jgi:RNA polymerase sigma-70 factor (ECF subfamily)
MLPRETTAVLTQDADALLVQRAKQRVPSAWAEIYDTTYPKLYRYCYARTTNDAAAAELASHVYLQAVEGIDRYEFRGRPLLAWLYRIARNVVSDHLRKREREARALERAAADFAPSDPGPAAAVNDRHDIEQALRHLTGDQRLLIELRFFGGFTTVEIADAMDRSPRAIYSLEVRALASLRRLMEPGDARGGKHVA